MSGPTWPSEFTEKGRTYTLDSTHNKPRTATRDAKRRAKVLKKSGKNALVSKHGTSIAVYIIE